MAYVLLVHYLNQDVITVKGSRMSEPTTSIRNLTHRALSLSWGVSVHLFGVLGIALLGGVALSDASTMSALFDAREVLLPLNAGAVSVHVAMSALFWGVCVCGYKMLSAPRKTRRLRLATSRGTAIVEMLIILMPFLMMTGGLAQLSINNITGVAAHLAAYQAGRTYWVWEKEFHTDTERPNAFRVTSTDVQRIARLSAASALAPVAPSTNVMTPTSTPDELKALRGVMFSHFQDGGSSSKGSTQITAAGAVTQGGQGPSGSGDDGLAFDTALDSDNFASRAARKLTFAYEATTVTPETAGGEVGATVVYLHFQAFPWFGWLFGSQATVAGRQGYYATYTRTYTVAAQVEVQ